MNFISDRYLEPNFSLKIFSTILILYYHRTSKKAFNYSRMTELRNIIKYTVGNLLDLVQLHDSQLSAIKQEGLDYE